MFVKNLASLARFNAARMGKTTVAQGEFLFAGLNSFEPGQEHAPHAHEGQDKLYVVLQGACLAQVGALEERLSVGDAAPSRPPASFIPIRYPGPQRLVVLTILAPAPRQLSP